MFDGTFGLTPKIGIGVNKSNVPYVQLVTLQFIHEATDETRVNELIPCIFILAKNKTEKLMTQALVYLVKRCLTLGVSFTVKSIDFKRTGFGDFEIGLR